MIVMPQVPSSNSNFKRIPDSENKFVQIIIDEVVEKRAKYNLSFWSKIFGKKSLDRDDVYDWILKEPSFSYYKDKLLFAKIEGSKKLD
jgi:hypothetical protein